MHNFKMLRPVDHQYQIKTWTHDYKFNPFCEKEIRAYILGQSSEHYFKKYF